MSSEQGFALFDLASDPSIEWPSEVHLSKSSGSGHAKSDGSTSSGMSPLSPEGGRYVGVESKYDNLVFVIHCVQHDKIAVSKSAGTQAMWLPYTPHPPNKTWNEGALAGALVVLSGGNKARLVSLKSKPPYREVKCMHILRTQLPFRGRPLTQMVYGVKLDPNVSSFTCCTNTDRLEWLSPATIATKLTPWGPELVQFSTQIAAPFGQYITEWPLSEAMRFMPRDPALNSKEAILFSIKITEKDMERLYVDYLDHCFPSPYMSFYCFTLYMKEYGFESDKSRQERLFRAFNAKDHDFISFHEFLFGLSMMESMCVHNDKRLKFVFRYYNYDNSGALNKEQLADLVADIHPLAYKESKDEINKRVNNILGDSKSLTLADFAEVINAKKLHGTSNLCRSQKPIFIKISSAIADRTLQAGAKSFNLNLFNQSYKGTCTKCIKKVKYRLAAHSVAVNSQGVIMASELMDDTSDNAKDAKDDPALKHSIEVVFNGAHVANQMLKLVRSFNPTKGTNKNPNGLMTTHPDKLLGLVKELCKQVTAIVSHESKCHKARAPAYIIGDIHGNLEDLFSLEKAIWRRAPCNSAQYVFLGDYVDRGRWGLECALYLMALKALMPNSVVLLRGNHEERNLQAHYSYKAECIRKYGEQVGTQIWEHTNTVFDVLPVCAIAGKANFCAHGGIPRSASKLEEINQIERILSEPQSQSPIAWEILWSDPCHSPEFQDFVGLETSEKDIDCGYAFNKKRGTAFFFNELAAKRFLEKNGLTHIIRAHEVPQPGYNFHFGNVCTTIFSCSHYCGNANEAAVILVQNQIMRVIHLDTVNNAPATD